MADVVKHATTPTSCSCCGECVTGALTCRQRGGLASLCGFAEFTTPSTPPKKYRKRTSNGTLFPCQYLFDTVCGTLSVSYRAEYSGVVCAYDKATCALTRIGDEQLFQDATPGPCPLTSGGTSAIQHLDCSTDFPYAGDINTRNRTKTSETVLGNGNCGSRAPGSVKESGSVTSVLTDEDTDADAIDRLFAGPAGTWSPYGPGACIAGHEERTTGFDFDINEVQWRVEASGLTPNTAYNVPIQFFRGDYGSGIFALFQTITASGNSDADGNLQLDGDVPNALGFETYAQIGTCL